MPRERFLRTSEVAIMLHVSPKTVSRWAKEGRLPYRSTLGGHRRYPADEIRRLTDMLAKLSVDLLTLPNEVSAAGKSWG
jgi:excisionase family DNA binding protein